MCGRYVASSPPGELARYFGAEVRAEQLLGADYNVTPTRDVFTVLQDGDVRVLDTSRWGLIPFWAKDAKIGNKMINARSETVAEKNAFRSAFKKKRCIIPADGFYEWTKPDGKKRQPWFIHRPDGEPYAFAGLWETWKGPERDQEPLRSCTILTGAANAPMSKIHDRMPIMLPPSAWDMWLDPELDDQATLGKLLVPAPPEVITFHPVSTDVNNARSRGAELVEPVELDPSDDVRLDDTDPDDDRHGAAAS
jgi:putative SOS response-associated peptidase YedK